MPRMGSTAAQNEHRRTELIRMWNEGVSAGVIADRLDYAGGTKSVHSMVRIFRQQGFQLDTRERVPVKKPHLRDGLVAAEAENFLVRSHNFPPAIIMDATGKPVATMDPMTRARRKFGR